MSRSHGGGRNSRQSCSTTVPPLAATTFPTGCLLYAFKHLIQFNQPLTQSVLRFQMIVQFHTSAKKSQELGFCVNCALKGRFTPQKHATPPGSCLTGIRTSNSSLNLSLVCTWILCQLHAKKAVHTAEACDTSKFISHWYSCFSVVSDCCRLIRLSHWYRHFKVLN